MGSNGWRFFCGSWGWRQPWALPLPHKLEHFLLLRDAGDATVVAGGEAGGAAGKAGDGGHVLCRQRLRGFIELQHLAHGAAAEDIPGSGGIHHMDAGGAGGRAAAAAVGKIASPRAHGDINKADAVLPQQPLRRCRRSGVPQEIHFFIADFDDIRLMQPPLHLRCCRGVVRPKRFTQVGVKADELALRFGVCHRLFGCGSRGLIGQTQRAEMEHPADIDQAVIHLVLGQAGIGAGLAGKAEFPVSIGIQRDERHGGKGSGVFYDTTGLNAAIGGGLNEQTAKAVVPDLPDHCGGAAVFLQCGEKIAGRAARLGL